MGRRRSGLQDHSAHRALKPALSRSRLKAASAAQSTFSRTEFYRLSAGSPFKELANRNVVVCHEEHSTIFPILVLCSPGPGGELQASPDMRDEMRFNAGTFVARDVTGIRASVTRRPKRLYISSSSRRQFSRTTVTSGSGSMSSTRSSNNRFSRRTPQRGFNCSTTGGIWFDDRARNNSIEGWQ